MDFQSFLQQLKEIKLSNVASFDYYAASGGASWAGASTVLIGCGSWETQTQAKDQPLLLQNKGAARRFNRAFTSVTQFVAEAPADILEGWMSLKQTGMGLQEFVSGLHFVSEDASPDSVFAIVLLLARAMGADDPLLKDWISAVDAWERTGTADDPYRSWCSLETSLAHASLRSAHLSEASTYTQGLEEGIRFAAASLHKHMAPNNMPMTPGEAYHLKAFSALEDDEREYREWLSEVPIVQLSLPLSYLPTSKRLVDALFIEERRLTGAAKNFYRNDRVNSPLKQGFALSITFRPQSTEASPDITIAVDPRKHVSLHELWETLEKAETAAWPKATRPTHNPRQLDGVENIYTEPWFINSESTLLGAPRKIGDECVGRLTWRTVQDLVLQECGPLRDVKVVPASGGTPVPILSLDTELRSQPSEKWRSDEKTLVLALWPRKDKEEGILLPSVLPEAPMVQQFLATLTHPQGSSTRSRSDRGPEIGVADIVAATTFEKLYLTGGFAIISNWGVFLLDDWSKERLEAGKLRETFEHASSLYIQLSHDVKVEMERISTSLDDLLKHPRKRNLAEGLVRSLSRLDVRLAHLRSSLAVSPADENCRLLKQAMDRRWSLEDRLAALESHTKAANTAIRNLSEFGASRINRAIVLFGFTLTVSSGIAAAIAKSFYHQFMSPEHISEEAPGWWILAAFACTAALVTGLVLLIQWLTDPLRDRQKLG